MNSYWRNRFRQLEETQFLEGQEYCKTLQEQFRIAENSIQMDIEKWYHRLAENNDISYASAKKFLTEGQLEEFKWDLKQYIEKGESNALNKRLIKQLENASARHHISYLEAMKLQIQQEAERLYTQFEGGATDFLKNTYAESYYHSAYEIARGSGVGNNLYALNEEQIEKIIKRPWAIDGENYSSRIWTNKEKLLKNLNMELTQNIIRGAPLDSVARRISKHMDAGLNQAKRLVRTESAALASSGQKDCFKALGVEKFEIVETLDGKTCELCGEMDEKHFPMTSFEVGVTVPPFHPNCRGCVCPFFDDEFSTGEKRAARNKDGNTILIMDMPYKTWKNAYVITKERSINIRIPKEIENISGMTVDYISSIKSSVKQMNDRYWLNFKEIAVENWGEDKPDVPFFCQYMSNNGKHAAKLVVNSGYDFSGFDDIIKLGYEYGYFAGKNVEDYIIHEIVHMMTGQDIETAEEFSEYFERINKLYVPGVSGYSDEAKNGFETIAESYIRIKNGEDIPDEARKYIDEYIERWKKE